MSRTAPKPTGSFVDPWRLPDGPIVCRYLGCEKPATSWVVLAYASHGTGWCRSHSVSWVKANGEGCLSKPMSEVKHLAVNA